MKQLRRMRLRSSSSSFPIILLLALLSSKSVAGFVLRMSMAPPAFARGASRYFFRARSSMDVTKKKTLRIPGRFVYRSSSTSHAATAKESSSSSSSWSSEETLPPIPAHAHRFVLMRHGESSFNNANIFTGFCDVALTPRGIVEAVEAGEVFRSHEIRFCKCYTSLLTRSIVTSQRCLEAAGIAYTPIQYDWRLNERHYGALQGLSKDRTAERLGRATVMQWRRSYMARPPLMTPDHPHYAIINQDARYQHVLDILPLGESLEDCQKRVVQGWEDILKDVQTTSSSSTDDESEHSNKNNNYSLVVAHANSLRALVMHLDEIPVDKIEGLNIPTAIPFYYDIDCTTGKVVMSSNSNNNASTSTKDNGHFRGIYISDERNRRNFLERRRAANDPWLWALHDDQVAESMLVGQQVDENVTGEGLEGLEEEAKHNTEVFSSALSPGEHDRRL